jgi:hypothetical protein
MKIKVDTYSRMLEKIKDEFGEYLEMGCSLELYLLSKLHIEREKNYDLQIKIDWLERRNNS